ncbi:MAG TPA: hypothetical protein VLB76_15775 [Thermoanaerobaculia bacterium]|jgi:hypothetical protein|nr:hypothetical protein [Thermoanaerobaculia bacterium]
MKKKMERLDNELFRPLTDAEQKRIGGAFTTYTAVTIYETATSTGSDFVRDGDHE